MSLEAITEIKKAEEQAALALHEAEQSAKRMVSKAREDGEGAVLQATERAKSELAELKRTSGEKARQEALDLAHNTENRKAALLVRAESRRERAIKLVVEGIVRD
jgi:vacuolar-type H+-ATPase subunit H